MATLGATPRPGGVIRQHLERFLAAGSDQLDAQDARRARRLNLFALIAAPAAVLATPIWLSEEKLAGALITVAVLAQVAALLIVTRRGKRSVMRLFAHLFPATLFGVLWALILVRGPDVAVAGWFLGVVPLLGAYLIGPRAAGAWLGVTVMATCATQIAAGMFPTPGVFEAPPAQVFLAQVLLQAIVTAFAATAAAQSGRQIRDLEERERVIAAQAREIAAARDTAVASAHAKSAFLASMSHEIRTPMNGVLGMTELLMQTDLTAEQLDRARTIQASGETLMTILNDILDLSKIEAGKLEIENIGYMVRREIADTAALVSEQAAAKGLRLIQVIEADVPEALQGDPTRLRQVISNLLANAIKFTDEGVVVVRVSQRVSGAGRYLRIDVSDTGIGIPDSMQTRLFDSFAQADAATTRRYGGTGLGLAISRQLVELMGGTIGLYSTEGEGSTFWLEIPLLEASSEFEDLRREADAEHHLLAGRVILLAHEDKLIRTAVGSSLEYWGARVVELFTATWASPRELGRTNLVLTSPPLRDMVDAMRALQAEAPGGNAAGPPLVLLAPQNATDDVVATADVTVRVPTTRHTLLRAIRDVDIASVTASDLVEPRTSAGELPCRTPTLDVLLVEDNPVNRRVATAHLSRLGHRVRCAGNGREALESLDEYRPDIVLIDCQMPVMDGFETTRAIRATETPGDRLPVVAMTASALAEDALRCREAGMDDVLTKPFTAADLERIVAGVVARTGDPGPHGEAAATQQTDADEHGWQGVASAAQQSGGPTTSAARSDTSR